MVGSRRSPKPGRTGETRGFATALGLALGPAVALGLARFAYALLLPAMRASLHWTFFIAGAMNAANALGYLAGALLVARIARRLGIRRSFLGGLAVTVATLLATGGSRDVFVLLFLRTIAGVSGAVSFVAGAGLVAELARHGTQRRAASLLGIYFAGGGAGIVVSGLAIPWLLDATGAADGWQWGWVMLAGMGALALGVSTRASRETQEPRMTASAEKRWPAKRFSALLVAYTLFGAGYIAYMTFIIAYLESQGAGASEITWFWVILGCAAILGAFAWARPIASLAGGRGPAAVLAVLSVGALLPLIFNAELAAIGSAILFGGSFLSVVTAMTAVARRSLAPHHWTPAIATLTVAFALGQSIGPLLSGALSDGRSGLVVGLGLSAGVLVVAAFVALAQRSQEIPTMGASSANWVADASPLAEPS